jgi:hypothetical protein
VVRFKAEEEVVCVRGKISDKNLEQRINIKFCVKIGKNADET